MASKPEEENREDIILKSVFEASTIILSILVATGIFFATILSSEIATHPEVYVATKTAFNLFEWAVGFEFFAILLSFIGLVIGVKKEKWKMVLPIVSAVLFFIGLIIGIIQLFNVVGGL